MTNRVFKTIDKASHKVEAHLLDEAPHQYHTLEHLVHKFEYLAAKVGVVDVLAQVVIVKEVL